MSELEKIQQAEQQVAELQAALTTVQNGLQEAEATAQAVEDLKARTEKVLRVTLGLIGLSIVLLVLSRRRPRS